MMKKTLLIILSLLFVAGLLLSRVASAKADDRDDHGDDDHHHPSCTWNKWTDTSSCIAIQCGSSEGTQTQSRTCTKEECDQSCPVVHFAWTTRVVDVPAHFIYAEKVMTVPAHWGNCPNNYSVYQNDSTKCRRNNGNHEIINKPWVNAVFGCSNGYESNPGQNNCRMWVGNTYKNVNHSANVAYEKSNDPNKCHRPSDNTLTTTYGMDNDARHEFKEHNSEWKDSVDVNCHQVVEKTETRSASCEAAVVACEDPQCPTECGHEKTETCDATPACVDPTPTPTPEPNGKVGRDFYAEPLCNSSVTLHFTFTESDGKGAVGKDLRFTYANESAERKTDSEGKARVDFPFKGESEAKVFFDGTDMTTTVTSAKNCPAVTTGSVLGATTGQVLGATTMAGTGVFTDTLMNIIGLSGSALAAFGLRRYGKKN